MIVQMGSLIAQESKKFEEVRVKAKYLRDAQSEKINHKKRLTILISPMPSLIFVLIEDFTWTRNGALC